MKLRFSLGAASLLFALTLVPSATQAEVYDGFDSDTAGDPLNPALWNVIGDDVWRPFQTASILSISNATATSTATFGYGDFTFVFSDSPNISYRGFGLETAGGDRILLRDDMVVGSLRLDVYTGGVHVVNPALSATGYESGSDDTWRFQYASDHLVLSHNDVVVFSQTLSLTSDPVRITLFTYSGGWMKLDSVAVSPAPVPEPSSVVLITGAAGIIIGIRQCRSRRYCRSTRTRST